MLEYIQQATDGTKIHCLKWEPENTVKGIIYIAHGMGEHAARYDWTAQQLSQSGYVVIANDHRGHGKTAIHLGDFGENGWSLMVDDMHAIIQSIDEQYPGHKKVLFGHSMGALLSQQYITHYGDNLDALVLSGSPGFSAYLQIFISGLLCRFESWRLGPLKESRLLNFLIFGSANKQFEKDLANPSGFEWLSRDQSEVQAYIDDAMCGFVPFPNSLQFMFQGIKLTQDTTSIQRIPRDLPIYLFSGTADPVHGEFANINRLLDALRNRGLDTTTKFYLEGRHEMLNETTKAKVISDLIAWLESP